MLGGFISIVPVTILEVTKEWGLERKRTLDINEQLLIMMNRVTRRGHGYVKCKVLYRALARLPYHDVENLKQLVQYG